MHAEYLMGNEAIAMGAVAAWRWRQGRLTPAPAPS